MIPTTIFEIIDKSRSQQIVTDTATKPLFLVATSSDKGPEDLRLVDNDFYKLYGKDISYERHGQPLLQAANIVDNGGRLLIKRVVAEDATLANIAVVANVIKKEVQKTDAKGNLIYSTPSGTETTLPDGNTPTMISVCDIKYEAKSVTGAKNIQSIAAIMNSSLEEGEDFGEYPLFVISDNGRGVSNKKFRISPLYEDSKYLNYIKYTLEIIENDEVSESVIFTINPDVVELNVNKSIQTATFNYSKQVKSIVFEDNYKMFVEKIAQITGETVDFVKSADVIFGKDRSLKSIPNIKIDSEGFNLSYIYGISLDSGSNGSFKDAPFGTVDWETQIIKVFDGTFDDAIYDVDKYKIDIIVDANYPPTVKRSIENLVAFREDLSYFRDLGLGLNNLEDILLSNMDTFKDIYCDTYHVSYDIIDPFTKKQIPVTIGYSLARLFINHFQLGISRPFAGQVYNMIIPEAIPGTVNFIPKVTPSENQKQILSDNRINYVSYYDDLLTLETLYTSQSDFSQLSYLNNVLAIQEVVKAVRTKCPKIRYTFITGDDLDVYRRDVQTELDKFSANFEKLTMVYTADSTMTANKIFNASIEVTFKDFAQTEIFKIFTLQ